MYLNSLLATYDSRILSYSTNSFTHDKLSYRLNSRTTAAKALSNFGDDTADGSISFSSILNSRRNQSQQQSANVSLQLVFLCTTLMIEHDTCRSPSPSTSRQNLVFAVIQSQGVLKRSELIMDVFGIHCMLVYMGLSLSPIYKGHLPLSHRRNHNFILNFTSLCISDNCSYFYASYFCGS